MESQVAPEVTDAPLERAILYWIERRVTDVSAELFFRSVTKRPNPASWGSNSDVRLRFPNRFDVLFRRFGAGPVPFHIDCLQSRGERDQIRILCLVFLSVLLNRLTFVGIQGENIATERFPNVRF